MARPPLDKEKIRRSFDRAAPTYDAHAHVQARLALALAERIDGAPASILELGSGTGTLTEHLRARFPDARIVAVDFAPAMAERTQAAVPDAQVLVADAEALELDERFDLTVSSATIQWLADPQETLRRLVAASDRVLLGTFGPRTFHELDAVFAELGAQRGFPLLSAASWATLLRAAGARRVRTAREEVSTEYPSCAAFLSSLRALGATAGAAPQPRELVAEAIRRYDERFGGPHGVTATYELVLLDATVSG
jgi:malonyl-CoA O-methyltransferase